MKKVLSLIVALAAFSAQAAQIQTLKVSGEKGAEIAFVADAPLASMPKLSVDDGQVTLVFSGTGLSTALSESPEISSPHALVSRMRLKADGGNTRVELDVNGATDKLRDRVKLQKSEGGVTLVVSSPAGGEATLALLQEEQASLLTPKTATTSVSSGFAWLRWMFVFMLLVATGIGSYYFLKVAKKKGVFLGGRRHLIETVAQVPIGGKNASIAVLKVGAEFVMVGVTANQVTFLSNLPKLAEQYESENDLERGSFKEAIAQEVSRARRPLGMEA